MEGSTERARGYRKEAQRYAELASSGQRDITNFVHKRLAAEREFVSVVGAAPGTQLVSPTDTDGEQGADALPEGDDDDDEDIDGAVLLEDSDEEDGDVGDVRSKEED